MIGQINQSPAIYKKYIYVQGSSINYTRIVVVNILIQVVIIHPARRGILVFFSKQVGNSWFDLCKIDHYLLGPIVLRIFKSQGCGNQGILGGD